MTTARIVIVVGSLLVAAGCGGHGTPAAHSHARSSVIPWTDQTRALPNPSPWAQPGSASAPPCTTADLGRGFVFMQGATGSMLGVIRLTNTSPSDCTMVGTARLTILAANQSVIPTRRSRLRDGSGDPHWSGYPIVALRPGQRTLLPIQWLNLCHNIQRAARFHISWQAGTLTVPVKEGGEPRCDSPSAPSTLAVGRLQPDQRLAPPPPRQLTLSVEITAPAVVKPGERIDYQITLDNNSEHAVVFHRCPTYWQGLGTDADQVTRVRPALVLNCTPTPTIPPGGHAAYAMRVTIPATAKPGENTLVWTFEPVGVGGGTKALLRIV